ncbi:MAG: hypothetical protein U5K79_24085 [Cyclobacteriaceae bacterium]|nr:hypothetical protein [Cyclobacteriaceae bacterium]
MSKSNYDSKLREIQVLPDDITKQPGLPVGEAVQEAENLVAWCQADKTMLTGAGLKWSLVEDLPVRAGACRYAQSIWARESQSKEEAQKEWRNKSPQAFALRDELLHHFSFAYRNDADLMAKVQTIREGSSNADMLQDLSDLHVLGAQFPDPLRAIGMDMTLLDTAANTSDELSVVLGRSNGENGADTGAKIIRDKAFAYMKMAMDEIRATGQYVFWRDENRDRGYVSTYFKRKKQYRKKVDVVAK